MHEEKRLAKELIRAHLSGDKAVAVHVHTAMRGRVRTKAERMAETIVNDNA
jgi:hypothetical protein